jgi:DNA-binding HxlR family transcriptional regulator
MGGTPGGIIDASCSATAGSYGASNGTIRGVTISVTMVEERMLRNPKRQSAPRPGRPVRGSTSGRPLMAALDLLGRRWSLRVLWELRDGPLGARALRERCDAMSPSVLYQRLDELTEARLVDRDAQQHYRLTDVGRELAAALEPLDRWAVRWAETE